MVNKKILIVDDDQDARHGLNLRLRANGYNTVFAGDATSAVSVAKKEKPDLIILDIGLPAGDGFVVMERLQGISFLAGIPVIVLSARDPLVNKQRALESGATAFFQKPADNHELMEAVSRALVPVG